MRILTVLFAVWFMVSFTGCASQKRTKWTDKTMRVMIDPDSISAEHYVMISNALVKSGRFIVVDRAAGYNAIKNEQERTHRRDVDRFADREKYAHWGKMYGVGGVVVAHADCNYFTGVFTGRYQRCSQHLAIMDTNTAEVLAVADGEAEGGQQENMISWSDVVADLEVAYPKYFEKDRTEERLEQYKQLSKEEATRAKENLAREEIDLERKKLEVERLKIEAEKRALEELKRVPAQAPVELPSVEAPKAPELPKAEVSSPEVATEAPVAPEAVKAKPELPEQASEVAKEKVAKKEMRDAI